MWSGIKSFWIHRRVSLRTLCKMICSHYMPFLNYCVPLQSLYWMSRLWVYFKDVFSYVITVERNFSISFVHTWQRKFSHGVILSASSTKLSEFREVVLFERPRGKILKTYLGILRQNIFISPNWGSTMGWGREISQLSASQLAARLFPWCLPLLSL